MFTVKTMEDYEITIHCDPNEFTWKKFYPVTGRYVYKYPDVPEFTTTFKIFGSEPHSKLPEPPRIGNKYIIVQEEWMLNGIEDDFFGLKKGDVVMVFDVEEYENTDDWCAFVKRDSRMVDMGDEFAIGTPVAFFSQEHVQKNVIARYIEC